MFGWFKKTNKQEYNNSVLSQMRTAAAVTINEKTALENISVVLAAVRVISEEIACLPFPVYRRLDNGGKSRDRKHPVHDLLNLSPDGVTSSLQWRESTIAHVLTWGNSYSEIEFANNGTPLKLHLLDPSKVTVNKLDDGSLEYKIEGENVALPASNILHFAGLGFDGVQGYSPIKMAKKTLQLTQNLETFGNSFFENGARPGGIISHPGTITDVAHKNLRESLDNVHQGAENFGKWIIFEEGMQATTIGVPPEDAQFLGSRVFQIQEICRIYRIPCTFLQENSRATFSNTEQEAINFMRHTLRPWCCRIEAEIQRKLFSESDRTSYFAEHLVDGILRGDTATRTASLHQQFMDGAVTIDEWRAIENRNPVENPDEHFVPMNMQTLGQVQRNAQQQETEETVEVVEPLRIEQQEEPTEEQPTIETNNLMRKAAKVNLDDVLKRMQRREENAVIKASKNAKEFLDFIDTFYEHHLKFVSSAIYPALQVFALVTNQRLAAETVAKDICENHKNQLLELSGTVTATNLQSAVLNQIEKWRQTEIVATVET